MTDSSMQKAGAAIVGLLLKTIDEGVGPITGARDYADSRLRMSSDAEAAIRRIVNETVAASGATGFATGLGGFVTLPATLPANITGQAILNARMVAAIAHLRGWDIHDEMVRYSILIVIAGANPNAVLAQLGVKVGQQAAVAAIRRIPIEVIRAINKRVGFMLLAKYGTKRSAITLVKLVPLAGGVVGGAVDAGFTKTVSTGAKRAFPRVGPAMDNNDQSKPKPATKAASRGAGD